MKCPKCGFENRPGSKFCNECGNNLATPCPKCGRANQPRSKFCSECGQELIASRESQPVDPKKPQTYTPNLNGILANGTVEPRNQ